MVLNLPYILRKMAVTNSSISIEPLQLSVMGTFVPQINVPSVNLPFQGQHLNVTTGSRTNHPPIDIAFTVDNRFYNYWIIWKWLDVMNTAITSIYGGTPDQFLTPQELINSGMNTEYQTTISIFAMDEFNNKIVEFLYYAAFPVSLSPLQLSYADNKLMDASCQFQFNQIDMKLITPT